MQHIDATLHIDAPLPLLAPWASASVWPHFVKDVFHDGEVGAATFGLPRAPLHSPSRPPGCPAGSPAECIGCSGAEPHGHGWSSLERGQTWDGLQHSKKARAGQARPTNGFALALDVARRSVHSFATRPSFRR